MGLILSQYSESEKSIRAFKECINWNDNIAMAFYYLCTELANNKKIEKAMKIIKEKICNMYPIIEMIHVETYFQIREISQKRAEVNIIDSCIKY